MSLTAARTCRHRIRKADRRCPAGSIRTSIWIGILERTANLPSPVRTSPKKSSCSMPKMPGSLCKAASRPSRAWALAPMGLFVTASQSGDLPGPRILTSLRQINKDSGDPEALRALVRQTKAEGADLIKLFATSGLGVGRRSDNDG